MFLELLFELFLPEGSRWYCIYFTVDKDVLLRASSLLFCSETQSCLEHRASVMAGFSQWFLHLCFVQTHKHDTFRHGSPRLSSWYQIWNSVFEVFLQVYSIRSSQSHRFWHSVYWNNFGNPKCIKTGLVGFNVQWKKENVHFDKLWANIWIQLCELSLPWES